MSIRTEEIDGRTWNVVEDDEPEPAILRQPFPVAAPVPAPTKIADDAPAAVVALAAAYDAARTAYDAAVAAAKEASAAVSEGEENYALLIAIDEVDSTADGDAIEEDLFKQKLRATALANALPVRLARCEALRKTLAEITRTEYLKRVDARKAYSVQLESELIEATAHALVSRTRFVQNAYATACDEATAKGTHHSFCEPIQYNGSAPVYRKVSEMTEAAGFNEATACRHARAGYSFAALFQPMPFSEVPTK